MGLACVDRAVGAAEEVNKVGWCLHRRQDAGPWGWDEQAK
jgi:hypothetical protein